MKAKRMRPEKAVSPRGFSRWVQPNMGGYVFRCCDCGLMHEMQFRLALAPIKKHQRGQSVAVQFRARRK